MKRGSILISGVLGLILGAAAFGQNQPLPKPVTPPLPDSPPPATAPPRINPPPALGGPRGAIDPALAPFVDGTTLAVARLDLRDLDLNALQNWISQGAQKLRTTKEETARAQVDVSREMKQATDWLNQFKTAGASRIYAVASLSDLMEDRAPFLVIPLENGGDARKIEAIFNGAPQPADQTRRAAPDELTATQIGHAVVVAPPDTLKRLKSATPAARPDMSQAFEAAGAGQLHLAVVPLDDARKALEGLVNNLPDELGGGSIQVVSRGLAWASLGLSLPPKPSMQLIIQGTNPDATQKLSDVVDKAIAWAGDRKQGPREALAFTQFVSKLKPQVAGDRITIALDESQLHQLATMMAANMIQARNGALRTQVASNLRQITLGVLQYSNDNHGKLPGDLGKDIAPFLGGNVKPLWVDPLRPNQDKPYVYVRLADTLEQVHNPATAVLIYENHTTWDDGINVAFADGHVEWIADEKQFQQMLADTRKANAGATEMPQ